MFHQGSGQLSLAAAPHTAAAGAGLLVDRGGGVWGGRGGKSLRVGGGAGCRGAGESSSRPSGLAPHRATEPDTHSSCGGQPFLEASLWLETLWRRRGKCSMLGKCPKVVFCKLAPTLHFPIFKSKMALGRDGGAGTSPGGRGPLSHRLPPPQPWSPRPRRDHGG